MYDILILGAGPGGATAAIALANSGLKVGLVDKATFPRDKVCGDALSGKVVSLMKYLSPESLPALYDFSDKLGSWGIRFFCAQWRSTRRALQKYPHAQPGTCAWLYQPTYGV